MTEKEPTQPFKATPGKLPERDEDWTLMDMCFNDVNDTWKQKTDIDWTCPGCGKEEKMNPVIVAAFSPSLHCDSCCASQNVSEPEKVTYAAEYIPPIYEDTDIDLLPCHEASKRVLDWYPKKTGEGLWVVGDPRTGKTRSVSVLLKRLSEKGSKVQAYFHGKFQDEILEVMKTDKSFRKWKYDITSASILFIDDLFQSKLTERVETTLFEVIDERTSYRRPTIVTTNYTSREMRPRFTDEQRWKAFFKRVGEFFQTENGFKSVKTGKQQEMQIK